MDYLICGWFRPERYKIPAEWVSLYTVPSRIYIYESLKDVECELISVSSLWSSARVSVIHALLLPFLVILSYVRTVSQK